MGRSTSYMPLVLVFAILGFMCLLLQTTATSWAPASSWWLPLLDALSVTIFMMLGYFIARCAAQAKSVSGRISPHLAHDINNVLQIILGRVSVLVEHDDALSAKQRSELEAVMKACEDGALLMVRGVTQDALIASSTFTDTLADKDETSGCAARTVLVIDDHPAVATLACDLLQRLGHETLKATDPAEGLILFGERADEIDTVMVDWMMPGMTGDAVISAVRAIKPQVNVIVSSGHTLDADTRMKLDAGGVVLVPKPATANALAQALAN